MSAFIDLTGERFARLVVVSRNIERQEKDKHHAVFWNCICDCGNEVCVSAHNLRSGATKSCGCYARDQSAKSGRNNKKYNKFDLEYAEYGICTMTDGTQFIFDKEDYPKIKDICWHLQKGYVVGLLNGTRENLQRFLTSAPNGYVVDHINGDRLDNRKCNLRICKQSENSKNRKINKNNQTGYTGVQFYKRYGKWLAAIKVNYKKKYLGYFDKIEDAIFARKQAEILYFGEFTRGSDGLDWGESNGE